MRKEDKITFHGIQVTVKELTVGEVRHWMMDFVTTDKSKDNQSSDKLFIDQGFLQEFGLSDIIRMTDMKLCQLDAFSPSELKVITEKCKELNPDFFSMRRRVLDLVAKNFLID